MNDHEQSGPASSAPDSAINTSPAQPITCPFCGSADTEPMSLFGSQLSTAQYYCRACHTPFERIKQEPAPAK